MHKRPNGEIVTRTRGTVWYHTDAVHNACIVILFGIESHSFWELHAPKSHLLHLILLHRHSFRCDRPRPPTCAHLGAHMRMYADNCLLSRSADDAQTIDTSAIGVVTGVLIAVAVATHSFLSPQRCRSDTCSRLRPCAAIWDPSIDSGRRVCLGIGCSVGGGCCGCPWGVVELAGSASLQVGTHLLAVARCALPSRGVL